MAGISTLKGREENQIYPTGSQHFDMSCEKKSPAGSISQRACVCCGSWGDFNSITNTLHLIHGSIG